MPVCSAPLMHDPSPTAHAAIGPLDAACAIETLLDGAVELAIGAEGDEAWTPLRAVAADTTRRLADRGVVPRHLVVAEDDPPVVVGRLLSALSRHVDRLYAAHHTGRAAWESRSTADA